ncbi:MAG: tripartite tricarboxylate transporter TctB family protein [Chloroflexia bacterium]|nr:tripartite tricarboxylate transporter TctB family protein [Chloroflexia bacterium]
MPTDSADDRERTVTGDGAAAAATSQETEQPAKGESAVTGRISLDLVGGLFLLAVAAVFILKAGDDKLDWIFPLSLSYAAGIIGVYLTIRGLLGFGERTDTLVPILRGRGVDVFVFSVLTALYAGLARTVGFWTMSIVMLFGGAVYLDHARTTKRTIFAAVNAVAVCIVAYVLLRKVFYVALPRARWLPF